ncbi:MAG TPA: hypothetical protein DEH22_18150 [Chloroflexi bacterium]|nr:hypothetical protein [Chloroflexota bacterium]
MAEAETDLLTLELQAEIAEQLEAGHDLAYSALATEEGFSIERVAGNEEEMEGGYVIADESGVTSSQFVATEDGFAVITVDETEDDITVESIVGTFDEEDEEKK